ncbi:aspartate/glutamate racemase family protein [Roseococcus sp. DSY-14]|uniref:aspartate/glutamate racemase family protein n=1 Tax=Roseococcus sp. DSY-14 TaxID=3369650 RepID=UPI00387A977B
MDRRILFINPNASAACTAGIAEAIAPFGPGLAVASLPGGPPAIASWRDWFAVAEPLCRFVAAHPADAYVIACVSDPGLEAVREATPRPVLGMFRCAVAAAVARAERIGVLGFTAASESRHRHVLRAMGLEARLAAWEPLGLPMEVLTDPFAPRARIAAAAHALRGRGAEVLILGCAGLAGHAALAAEESGLPVIEPCRAAAALARLAVTEAAVASTAA